MKFSDLGNLSIGPDDLIELKRELKNQKRHYTVKWIEEQSKILVGLPPNRVSEILKMSSDQLSKEYQNIVRDMSWSERIELLRDGADIIGGANSRKVREIALITKIIETSAEILPILVAIA